MSFNLNRRQWIKLSAAAAAGLVVKPGAAAFSRSFPENRLVSNENIPVLLNSNESPYGISSKAREAMINALDLSHRYPHQHYKKLKALIADRENISPDQIILGAGSTEVMVMLLHLYGLQGEILAADPTYFDFVYYAEQTNCPLLQVPVNAQYGHDLTAMEKNVSRKTGMIYICNPNNPTGTITSKDELFSFCERISRKTMIVVDEAYHEYVEDRNYASMIGLLRKGADIMVTRTFSKIFGLAGLRIGYGIAKPGIIRSLEKIQRNFATIAYPSLQAAIAGYTDSAFLDDIRRKNQAVKLFLYSELKKLEYPYLASHTNFVLFKVRRNANSLVEDLKTRNIFVRPFVFKDTNWVRVSLGTLAEIKTFVSVLAEIG